MDVYVRVNKESVMCAQLVQVHFYQIMLGLIFVIFFLF